MTYSSKPVDSLQEMLDKLIEIKQHYKKSRNHVDIRHINHSDEMIVRVDLTISHLKSLISYRGRFI